MPAKSLDLLFMNLLSKIIHFNKKGAAGFEPAVKSIKNKRFNHLAILL
jgi:hypothetical protein